MIVYRFAAAAYSRDLSGEGAKRFGGRWNSRGNAVLYASTNISLALLELLIHSATYDEIVIKQLMIIDTGTDDCKTLLPDQLKSGWQNDFDYSRFIGDEFLKSQSNLLLKVPSAIIPEESNILINPIQSNFRRVKIKTVREFSFDVRLFKD